MAERTRVQGQWRGRRARHGGRGGRALPLVGGAARVARLRDRRSGGQGRPALAVAGARRHRPRAPLGGGVEVPADHRDDEAEPDRLERRPHGSPASVRDAGAGPRWRGDGFDRDPPQRGGPGAQGRPRGRRGGRHARRRRDPAGDRAADPAAQGQATATPQAARQVPDLRDPDGEARGLRVDHLPQPPRLPRPDLSARQALSRRRWTSRASARRTPCASWTRA